MRGQLVRALAAAVPAALRPAAAAGAVGGLLAVRGHKTTTGIVGLPLDEQAREHLTEKLNAVLQALEANGVPADAEYRRAVEKTVNFKLQALASDASDEELEERFERQLEEEIKMCDEELGLIPKMADWKPWDVPADHKVEILEETAVDAKLGGTTFAAPPTPPGV